MSDNNEASKVEAATVDAPPISPAAVGDVAAASAQAPSSAEARPSSRPQGDAPPPPPSGVDAVAEAKAEAVRMKEQWMRTAADFDNYRKRARREVEDSRKSGREDLLKDLLPVFDNLERAIASAQRATEVKPVADGLSMVVKQFVDVVSRAGISKVPTSGHPFDPSIHEAIQQVETDDHPPGTVVSEIQAGYMQGERLVRAAMVVVAKARSGAEAPAS